MKYLRFTNWESYQHYRDRNPPWIKLHNHILEDYVYCQLPDTEKAHLINLMLLASRTDNEIHYDPEWIKQKIGADSDINFEILLSTGFMEIVDASEMQAIRSKVGTNLATSAKQSKRRGKDIEQVTLEDTIDRMTDRSWAN